MNLDILKIASDTKNHKKLDDCTHKSKHKNPLCGDEMEVGVKISKNKILDFAYQCKSCIYCQASASLLAKTAKNKSVNKINNFIYSFRIKTIFNDFFRVFIQFNILLKYWVKYFVIRQCVLV